jgi:peptidoglycan/xylan/chitin deacetylase (PgdA/CDA1 family)
MSIELQNKGSVCMLPARILSRVLGRLQPHRITVLAYHRIASDTLEKKPGDQLLFSTQEATFRQHLQILSDSTNVISGAQLAGWLAGRLALPPNASLITFDDGYRDNLTCGLPSLREAGLPAIIYLSTGYMGSRAVLPWDLAMDCFRRAIHGVYTLPVTGGKELTPETFNRVVGDWFLATKGLPTDLRSKAVEDLAQVLNVSLDMEAFKDLYLSWDDVRYMQEHGIEFGAHAVTHPILTSIPDSVARQEIVDSKYRIESEIGQQITSFAYPNGLPGDYSDRHVGMVQDAGFDMAFTLSPGLTNQAAVRAHPYNISRIYVGYKDTPMRFVLKLWGVSRMRITPR